MELHLTHALILTQFESSLTALDWDSIKEQDFAVHALYCHETNQLLFHSDNQKSDCMKEISQIKQTLKMCGLQLIEQQQIVIMSDDECEYCAEDVKKHFNL